MKKQTAEKNEEYQEREEKKNIRIKNSSNIRERIIQIAKKQLGKPYLWGASGNQKFDCSSFVQYVYKEAADINLPRVSYEQSVFKPKIMSNIKKGDILFFETLGTGRISHVGIYVGGRQFIHASSKSNRVVISEFKGFYREKFRWAISVL